MHEQETAAPTLSRGFIVILAALVAFGPLSIDMYLPALPLIAQDLQASNRVVELSITFYLFGFSLGMFFYGPLSDRFGRRKLLLLGIAIYCLATIGCVLVQEGVALSLWRLLQALGGASASVLARAIVRDRTGTNDSARILSWMHIITMIATLIAPILGSVLADFFGWRAVFVALFLFSFVVLLVSAWKIPETLPPEQRLASVTHLLSSYVSVLKNRRAIGYIGCMSMTFAGMFVYITASPFVYIEYFGVSSQQYALLFALNIFAIMIFTFLNTQQVKKNDPQQMITFGAVAILVAAAAMFLIDQVLAIPFVFVIVGLFIYVGNTGPISANCIAKLMGLFPRKQAGTAAGLAVALQFGMGALLSFLVSRSPSITPTAMLGYILFAALLSFFFMWLSRDRG